MSHKRPTYADKVLARIAEARARGQLRPGTVHVVNVQHDEWCNLLNGLGPCNCNPDVRPPERIPAPDEN